MPRDEDDYDRAEDESKMDIVPSRGGRVSAEGEIRRNLRWTSFARPKVIFGFDHLSPAYVPSMSRNCQGLCVCLEKISGWHPPIDLVQQGDSGDSRISLSVNISLYHYNSVSFFGSTYTSESVLLSDDGARLPDTMNVDLSEVVYMLSRINDPSCIMVMEIVAEKEDITKNVVTGSYGCGWAQIPLFALNPSPPDISHGHENAESVVRNKLALACLLSHYYCQVLTPSDDETLTNFPFLPHAPSHSHNNNRRTPFTEAVPETCS